MKTALHLTIAAFGLATFNLSAATLYVSLESTNPIPPYATWATAAKVIQDAVDAAKAGDTVLVTNGVYVTGSREVSVFDTTQEPPQLVNIGPSRVVVTNSIRLESVNGPLATTINGGWDGDYYGTIGVRCAYIATNAVVSGFTLTHGASERLWYNCAGGVWSSSTNAVVTNCTLISNLGYDGGGASGCTLFNCTLSGNCGGHYGGGASGCTLFNCTVTGNLTDKAGGGASHCTLYNCTLTGNSSTRYGGGTSRGTLYNCTLTGNSAVGIPDIGGIITAGFGGGAFGGTLYNCIVYYNTAPNGANYFTGSSDWDDEVLTLLEYSCTTPLPTNGVGNIAGPPLFMDLAAGDFRLREESPCIDAGTNLLGTVVTDYFGNAVPYAHDATDILGNTRFIDGNFDGKVAWDIGAYEFNSFRPPRFNVQPQLTADGWKLNITGAANQWVHLQRSSNLKDWGDIWFEWMGADGVQQVNDWDMGQKAMFYRAVVP